MTVNPHRIASYRSPSGKRWCAMLLVLLSNFVLAQEFDGLYRSVDNDGAQRGGLVLKIEHTNGKLSGEISVLGEVNAKGKLQGEYAQGTCFLRSDLGDWIAYASASCDRARIAGTLNLTRKGEKQAMVTSFSAQARTSGLVSSPLPTGSDPNAVVAISKPSETTSPTANRPLEVYAAECASIYRHGDSLATCINSYPSQHAGETYTATDLRYLERARRCHPGLRAGGLSSVDIKRLAMQCEGRGR